MKNAPKDMTSIDLLNLLLNLDREANTQVEANGESDDETFNGWTAAYDEILERMK